MALIETIDPPISTLRCKNGIGAQLQWQIPEAELEHRLDAAAYAAAAILNAPFFENDLTPHADRARRCRGCLREVALRGPVKMTAAVQKSGKSIRPKCYL